MTVTDETDTNYEEAGHHREKNTKCLANEDRCINLLALRHAMYELSRCLDISLAQYNY